MICIRMPDHAPIWEENRLQTQIQIISMSDFVDFESDTLNWNFVLQWTKANYLFSPLGGDGFFLMWTSIEFLLDSCQSWSRVINGVVPYPSTVTFTLLWKLLLKSTCRQHTGQQITGTSETFPHIALQKTLYDHDHWDSKMITQNPTQ